MSNYKSTDSSFNQLCSYFIGTDISNNYYKNTNIEHKGSFDFTSIINEKPYSLGYSYTKDGSNIDISQYSIAKYIEKTGDFTIDNSDIPSWCTKIRAVLVGAGGSGGKGTTGNNVYTAAVNVNKLNVKVQAFQRQNERKKNLPNHETNTEVQANSAQAASDSVGESTTIQKNYANNDGRLVNTHTTKTTVSITEQTNTAANNSQSPGKGGAGGGGGGFIYLNEVQVVGKTLTVDASGGNITLYTEIGQASVKKGGDASGNGTFGSSGSTTISSNLNGVSHNGVSGSTTIDNDGDESGNSKLADISSSVSYGNGGKGGNGGSAPPNVTKDVSGNDGGSGQSSFCRIYFLTK